MVCALDYEAGDPGSIATRVRSRVAAVLPTGYSVLGSNVFHPY